MKIEKRKVTEAKPLSVAAKSAMGVMLGMTTAATFIACGGPVGEISDAIDENSSSSNEIQAPKSDSSSPESSNQAETQQSSSEQSEAQQNSAEQTGAQQSGQEQTETKQSSSSQVVVDIPLSHEPISSSVMEALSAAAESSSSSAASIPASATESTTSSSADTTSSAANPASSNEAVQPAASSESANPASSSSSEPSIREIQDACQGKPGGSPVDIGGQVYLCPDTGGGMMFSMISTFERTDMEV